MKNIFNDIKKGKNVDVYLSVLISIGLIVYDIFGEINLQVLMSCILMVLTLLSIGTLQIRNAAKNLKEKSNDKFLRIERLSEFTPFPKHFSSAKTIDWMSFSLYKAVSLYKNELIECLNNNGSVRILLLDQNSPSAKQLAQLGYFSSDEEDLVRGLNKTLYNLRDIKQHVSKGSIQVKLLPIQPPYRLTIINRNQSEGFVRIMPFVYPTSCEKPVISVFSSDNEYWFKYFSDQFEEYWNQSKEVKLE